MYCPRDLLQDNSSCSSAPSRTNMLHAAKVKLLDKKRQRQCLKANFCLTALMSERVKKPATPWAGQQDQSPDHTAQYHAEVPPLVQAAETCQSWYTMSLLKATSVPAETCISLNIHPPHSPQPAHLGLFWTSLQATSLCRGNLLLNIPFGVEILYRETLHDGKPLSHLFSDQTVLLGSLPWQAQEITEIWKHTFFKDGRIPMLFQLRANIFMNLENLALTKNLIPRQTTKQKVTSLCAAFSLIGSNQLLAVDSFNGSHAFGTWEKSHCVALTHAEELPCLWLYIM